MENRTKEDIKEAISELEENFKKLVDILELSRDRYINPNLLYRKIEAVKHLLQGSMLEMRFLSGLEYMEDTAFRLMHYTNPELLEYYKLHHLRNPKSVAYYVAHGRPPEPHE